VNLSACEAVEERAALTNSLARAATFLESLQDKEGFWEGEMVWNTMLLSQYVLVQKIVGREIAEETRRKIIRHYEVTRTREGAWAMHGEGEGFVFMTALAYVALRALGLDPENPLCRDARAWLAAQPGGILSIPSWGKFWLSLVGLYEYEGMNPVPPELFLLPEALPLHPNNYYCHTRYIYLGIGFLYGKRFRGNLGDTLTTALREELYGQPYESVDFSQHRHHVAGSDLYIRPSLPLRAAYNTLTLYEKAAPPRLRERALRHCFSRILFEQEVTRGQGLSPVNCLLNCLALFSIDPNHPLLAPSLDAIETWRWEDEAEGIRYTGAHSTAWDTAFAIRALLASPERERRREALARAYRWLDRTQMQSELPGDWQREQRDSILGGWCFSNGEHRWPVSDCTAEALSAILELRERGLEPEPRIADDRLIQAARFILARQNDDGGFGSYERRRAGALLELINPSEMYGNCMTERSYTECTASCVGALVRFRAAFLSNTSTIPAALREQVDTAIERSIRLLKSRQLEDGSYAGFWGVNFTYGIFHVVEAFVTCGISKSDPAIQRALFWLKEKQKPDGGWGEKWQSCLDDHYREHPESQATMTAWALLALIEGGEPITSPVVERAVACLKKLQNENGSWPRQAQAGVFFQTAMLDYRLYKDSFPTWALGRVAETITKV
jgi:squalene/oxidosqualene cyclase-like protein